MSASQALLVIDVQKALFEKSTVIYQAERLLRNINLLIEQARCTQTPIIFIQHSNDSFLARGSGGWQLHADLKPQPGDTIIHKTHGDAFEDTPLLNDLKAKGVDSVVVTGLVTHGCVKATCQGALKRGYKVLLVSDGHSNYHKKPAEVIEEWHQKLSVEGIELCAASEVRF